MNKDTLKENLDQMLFDMIEDKYNEFEYDYEKFVKYLFSIEKYLDNININQINHI